MCDTRWLTLYPLIREAGERAFEIHRALTEMGEHEWQAFREELAQRGDSYAMVVFDFIVEGVRELRAAKRKPTLEARAWKEIPSVIMKSPHDS